MVVLPDWAITSSIRSNPISNGRKSETWFTSTSDTTAYGEKALENECRNLASAPRGQRNDLLNKVSFRIGRLVAGGEINEAQARLKIHSAAADAGLGMDEITTTFSSGFESGLHNPRSSPEPNPSEWVSGRRRAVNPEQRNDTRKENPSQFAEHTLPEKAPGLVGEIARFVETQLTYKMPNIALATALVAISRLCANRFVVVAPNNRKTPLNLYVLMSAQSGAGKETTRTVLNGLGQQIADTSLIASQPASAQGLGRVLSTQERTPLLLFQDEYGKKLAHANSASGNYEAGVNAALLEMYGLALGTYGGRSYAKSGDDVNPSRMPYVCLLAASTLEPLADALQDGSIFDGTLNRFIYLPQPKKLIRNGDLSFPDLPCAIGEKCEHLWKLSTSEIHNPPADVAVDRESITNIHGLPFCAVRMTDAAHKMFTTFDCGLDPIKEGGGAKGALAARATENAIRIAGVIAVGDADDIQNVWLDESHAMYALQLVKFSTSEMLAFVTEELSITGTERVTGRLQNRIVEYCRECVANPDEACLPSGREHLRRHLRDGYIPRTLITLKFKRTDKRLRDAAIVTLVEAGDLSMEKDVTASTNAELFMVAETA